MRAFAARRMREWVAALIVLVAISASAQQRAEVRLLNGANTPLDPTRDVLMPSLHIPNDTTLPRVWSFDGTSDARDVRIELVGLDADEATIESVDALGITRHAQEHVALHREGDVRRSAFLRLVTTDLDAEAPDVTDRVLQVALGDLVRVTAAGATYEIRVASPRRARLRMRIVRNEAGGRPAIGGDEARAAALAREQVTIANEIWAQCGIGFGDPLELDVAVVDPPTVSMLSVADVDGLPARGGGVIRMRVDGRAIPAITTRPNARPVETALAIATALRRARFVARVFENERTENGADRSADVVVRHRDGSLVTITRDGDAPLSTDARQRVSLAEVDLGDGVREFDNMAALTGTLEERALIRAITDEDERTIDVLVVSEFTGRTRDGEAFVSGEAAGAPGSIANVVLVSREGIARARTAFTLAHELGHVLLDHPLHPDHLGPDQPWRLMDSDAADSTILGPRRLTETECARARRFAHLE
ncbi:ImmA/IrrE family metallo-endopeptidase [Sandaracinus amylolyticus]|uniref:ImmA/IrrE family metallo-endopeptidase n=1 Tax=Sandaracinus amylolyticus TaxID=927083 RepID=UPI001F3F858A|nr:hypothetical protein [Sandaracinus amylolyticus]UJR79105.1 Hypothetical protein I5071_11380 [Sandaracinus amylolyticus]